MAVGTILACAALDELRSGQRCGIRWRMRLFALLLALLAACSPRTPRPHEHRQPYHAHHRFEHAEDWVARFEDPSRDVWQKPDEVIRTLSPAPAASIADVGAGTGYFSVRLARAVPGGRVF